MPIQIETPAIRMLRDRLLETGGAPSTVAVTDESVAHADTEEALGGDAEAIALLGATIEAMVIMLAADGNASQAEKDLLRGAVRELTAGGVRSVEIDKLFEAALARVKDQGADLRLAEAAGVLKKETIASEAAFVLAAAMAFADQEIADAENETLNRFAELLGLEDERANQLLDELET
ncbi:MAG TPA: TerB family tellurite resistance protein [Byssovorax sp.]